MKEVDRTIRSANTTDFLKLCCLVVPKKTKPILNKIIDADLKIKNCLGELCMSSNPLEVVEQIEKIREDNNKNWMDLIRLAVTHAPDEAKVIMNRINKHDENINELFQQLSDNL